MLDLLKGKSVILFDVGYTLDYPLSGDWLFTKKFLEVAGEKFARCSTEEIEKARAYAWLYLKDHHLLPDLEAEKAAFIRYYGDIAEYLNLDLTPEQIKEISYDRATNMGNYVAYPDAIKVLDTLRKTHKLGIISDTWPSIDPQLRELGLYDYFESFTFSCDLGTFKPDERMYLDALEKLGCKGEDAVFIDDTPVNLDGAAKLGITPILIAANPASDVETKYTKIYSLSELIENETDHKSDSFENENETEPAPNPQSTEDGIKIARLTENNFNANSLDDFVRHQEVKECWRYEDGRWVLKPIAFTEEWSLEQCRMIAGNIAGNLHGSMIDFGAFDGDKLAGYITVGTERIGSRKQYVQLVEFEVSAPYRGRKIGRRLFAEAVKAARATGAEKLYISAHSSKESQAAYRALGCVNAEEMISFIAEEEPCDVQMEYRL